jgi:phage replication O-like protein O
VSIPTPNYTPIPNVIIDYWMPRLSSIEFNVLLFICRKTFGWHKFRDRISLSQIMEAVQSGRSRISEAIKTLIALNLVKKFTEGPEGNQKNYFEVHISNNSAQCRNGTPPSAETAPTKETNQNKETLKRANGSKPPEEKTYKREDRHVPDFIKIQGIPPPDWQKLANQFSESDLWEGLKEAKSYTKAVGKIRNKAAFITDCCKRYIKLRKEKENGQM